MAKIINVNCPYCGKRIEEDWSNYIIASDVVDADRGMGAEIEHIVEADELICSVCKKSFKVKGSIYEYPPEAYNFDDLEAYPLEED